MTTNRQIIIIPGIMGSVLRKQNSQIWPWLEILPGAYNRLVDINDLSITAPKLENYTYKFLKESLERLGDNVVEFPYDWRKNNLDHITLLEQKIDSEADEVILVAHSMGGIVAKLFLNQIQDSPLIEKISKLITLGTPWNGAMDSYKTLKYGKFIPEKKFRGQILNDKSSKEISSYFPSIYQLLPSYKYSELAEKTESKFLVSYRINNKNYYNHEEFFQENLNELFESNGHSFEKVFKDFYELLDKNFTGNTIHHEVVGVGSLTIAGISENSLGEADGDFRNGDGTVPLFSALTQQDNTYFVNNVEHQDLPKNPNVIELIKNIITNTDHDDENEIIFKSFDSSFNKGFSGQVVKVACPVTVSLVDVNGNVINGAIETIDEDGLSEILNKEYNIQNLGTTTYIILDEITEDEGGNELDLEEDFKKLYIQAYDDGPTSISIDKYEDGRLMKKSAFKTFEINTKIKAELTLSRGEEKNELLVEELDREPVIQEIYITTEEEDIIYPSTQVEIGGENILYINSQEILINNLPTFTVKNLERGTYDIDKTFLKINGEIFMLEENQEKSLVLNYGENKIEYFSKDVFGNMEESKYLIINFLPEKSLQIDLEFLPHQYFIKVKNNEVYENVITKYGLNIPQFEVIYDENSKVIGENIFYGVSQRQVTVNYEDIFGIQLHKEFLIDEDVVQQIFEGTASEKNIEDFRKNLNLDNSSIKFIMPEIRRGGPIRRVTKENISSCKEIVIEDEIFRIRILKDKKYTVSFQNLSEDIIFRKEGIYQLDFKVIDKDRNQDIRSMNLDFFIKVIDLDDELFSNDFNVVFDKSIDSYVAKIPFEIVNKLIREYWKTNQVINIEVVIFDRTTRNELRTQRISFRK
ncbi:hypothetical protein R0K17_11675 [Planococcus sp. SIMBA_143]